MFEIHISGHSPQKHNAEVLKLVTGVKEFLGQLPDVSGLVSGFSSDGEHVNFSEALQATGGPYRTTGGPPRPVPIPLPRLPTWSTS